MKNARRDPADEFRIAKRVRYLVLTRITQEQTVKCRAQEKSEPRAVRPRLARGTGGARRADQIPRHDARGDAPRAMDKQQASLEAGKKKVRAIEL